MTSVMHWLELPQASVAVSVTMVDPGPMLVPAVGNCVTVTTLHSSVTIASAVRSGTTLSPSAPQTPIVPGQVIWGGVTSTIEIVWLAGWATKAR